MGGRPVVDPPGGPGGPGVCAKRASAGRNGRVGNVSYGKSFPNKPTAQKFDPHLSSRSEMAPPPHSQRSCSCAHKREKLAVRAARGWQVTPPSCEQRERFCSSTPLLLRKLCDSLMVCTATERPTKRDCCGVGRLSPRLSGHGSYLVGSILQGPSYGP